MTKISIARRRLECQGFPELTQGELRAQERAAMSALYDGEFERETALPLKNELEGLRQTSAVFPLSREKARTFESILESPAVKGKEMRATFEKVGPVLMLRLELAAQSKKRYLTSRDVAEMLAVSRGTVYRLARDGRLKGHRVGRMWRFDFDEVLEVLSGCPVHRPPEGGEG